MSEITINEALVLLNTLRERKNGLKDLRKDTSRRSYIMYGEEEKKVTEPQYDCKLVDKKITAITNGILKMETRIKQSNAITKINTDEIDIDSLLSPIE